VVESWFGGVRNPGGPHELPRSMVFAGRIGDCRADSVSSHSPSGARAGAFQFADVPATDSAARHQAKQTRTYFLVAVAMSCVAAAGNGFCPAIYFERHLFSDDAR